MFIVSRLLLNAALSLCLYTSTYYNLRKCPINRRVSYKYLNSFLSCLGFLYDSFISLGSCLKHYRYLQITYPKANAVKLKSIINCHYFSWQQKSAYTYTKQLHWKFHPLHSPTSKQTRWVSLVPLATGGDVARREYCTRHTLCFQTDIVTDYDYRMIRLLLIKTRSCG